MTRDWIGNFVAGINYYQGRMAVLPHEFEVLGMRPKPWTVGDVLTIGRLAGSDVNWLVWASILPLRERDDWPEIWARLVSNGSSSQPSFDSAGDFTGLNQLLRGFRRSGSNSIAIAGARSGGAVGAAGRSADRRK